jgi:two-component system heavy metal sensor histidine kinase CusS
LTSRPKNWSLAARLAIWYAGSAFAIVLLATVFLYIGLASSLDSHADRLLADQVHVLSTLLTENPEDKDALEQEAREEADKSLSAKLWIRILGPDGSTIAQSAGMERLFASDAFPAASGVGEAPRPEDRELGGDRPFRVVSALVPLPAPSGARATIQLALDRDPDEDLLARFRVRLAIVCGTSLVFCSAAGFWIARRGLRPVAAITAAARSVSSATLAARIDPARFPRELADLAETFNAMLGRLEESFGKLTQFSADLAHELRTPVNNLRGEIEVTLGRARSAEEYRAVLGSCLEETARLTRIIESLLFLARAESGTDHARLETVELRAELETIVGFYEAAAQEKELILGIAPGPSPAAQVDRVLFQRAVGNVIANAIRATPPGGSITVSIVGVLDGAGAPPRIAVDVADTGAGISREHLPRVFERFFRADASRTPGSGGTGLGLAIVRSIVELHGGKVGIESEPGRGTRVSLVFPGTRAAVAPA